LESFGFEGGDRFFGRCVCAEFDFDEDQGLAIEGDEVDFARSSFESPRDDGVSEAEEVVCGLVFGGGSFCFGGVVHFYGMVFSGHFLVFGGGTNFFALELLKKLGLVDERFDGLE
jgi:hypothetical protein